MIDVTFQPFDVWPGESTAERKRAPFQRGYGSTLQLIEAELRELDAASIVIQINVDREEIRRDGMPRSDARPEHPGVILSFESRHGPLQYSCDDCQTWQDNLRAIGLTLERLRLAERYGVAKRGEQYRGWAALPAPDQIEFATRREAASWIARKAGINDATPDEISKAEVNVAIVACHPDKHGGSNELFLKLQKAREKLGL